MNEGLYHFFRPWTHWHAIKWEAYEVLLKAGFKERLCVSRSKEPPPPKEQDDPGVN